MKQYRIEFLDEYTNKWYLEDIYECEIACNPQEVLEKYFEYKEDNPWGEHYRITNMYQGSGENIIIHIEDKERRIDIVPAVCEVYFEETKRTGKFRCYIDKIFFKK